MKHTIFETKEQYLAAIKVWKTACKNKGFQFRSTHFAFYAIIRGKDPKKCFATPEQQSKKKLVGQGKNGNETYNNAISNIRRGWCQKGMVEFFQGTITDYQFELIQEHLKESK